MLIPSTITALRTRRYTPTLYIHHTIHGFGYNPMNDGGRYSIQSPFVSNLPPAWSTLPPPITLRLTKSALAAVHRSTGHQNPTDNEGVRKVMAGLARANGRPQRQAKPLTETALAAVKATAGIPRRYRDRAVRAENAWAARRRGQVDIALLSVLRDGLLRRSEAAALRWGDVEIQGRGSARLHVRRSKTDPEAEGAALYIGSDAASALVAIMSEGFAVVDPSTLVFGLSASQIGRRVNAAAKASPATAAGWAWPRIWPPRPVRLPALMTAGRWKRSWC